MEVQEECIGVHKEFVHISMEANNLRKAPHSYQHLHSSCCDETKNTRVAED